MTSYMLFAGFGTLIYVGVALAQTATPSVPTTTGARCCAALSETALEHGLLSPRQMEATRGDLEGSLPGLRACRQLLVVIPASLEDQPRVVDLLRDEETLGRLRRVHQAFGEALREERMSREIDSLDD